MNRIEFFFRIWIRPSKMRTPPEIHIWFHGIEPMEQNGRAASEWAEDVIACEDLYDIFDLDEDKHWQVFGKATLHGSYDHFGEYSDELDILFSEKAEVPESFYNIVWPGDA